MLTERRRRHAAKLIEYTVELGKAIESALLGDVGNLLPGDDQQLLGIADPGHLDIFGQCKTGDQFELVR